MAKGKASLAILAVRRDAGNIAENTVSNGCGETSGPPSHTKVTRKSPRQQFQKSRAEQSCNARANYSKFLSTI
jgi:hypothetical protein